MYDFNVRTYEFINIRGLKSSSQYKIKKLNTSDRKIKLLKNALDDKIGKCEELLNQFKEGNIFNDDLINKHGELTYLQSKNVLKTICDPETQSHADCT